MLAVAIVGSCCAFVGIRPLPFPAAHQPHATRCTGAVCQLQSERDVVGMMADDAKVDALFAWISRAFAGDERYNNLMLAFAAIYGADTRLQPLVDQALERCEISPVAA